VGGGSVATTPERVKFCVGIANLTPNKRQPYVGDAAFAHKGGIHIHAVQKNAHTYEHVNPESVGNRQRVLLSDHSGRSGMARKMESFGLSMSKDHPRLPELLARLKDLERDGYQFEGAEGSFELMVRETMGMHRPSFELLDLRVSVEKRHAMETPVAEATVKIRVGTVVEQTTATGDGPVNAIDNALRHALETFYPELREVRLLDYKVRVLAGSHGTASRVRVLIESGDHKRTWGTVGVSENIIEASWQALADSIEYKLLRVPAQGTVEERKGERV